ncbi:MAG: hypothetical protein EOO92_13640 [Pedobacter sp.]|nr:MAG: hypothetical protein EOO92_13640 [Pedobacter sp.]
MGGLNADWHQEVKEYFKEQGLSVVDRYEGGLHLLYFCNDSLLINLLDLNVAHEWALLIAIQDRFSAEGMQLIHLWQDLWLTRKDQVIGRINSILGLNKRIHARKTKIISIAQDVADRFLTDHHLQISASARYKYALVTDKKIVALACFSNLRKMPEKGENYRSAELIRFANISGYTVTGGFTKLLQHFIKLKQPNDVMSYADRDWSLGAAYLKSGFELVDVTSPLEILLDKESLIRYFPHRVEGEGTEDKYFHIFNTGNFKYILYL